MAQFTHFPIETKELSESPEIAQIEGEIDALEADVATRVPNTRKVNNKQLNADITLTAADVGAVPTGSGASEIGYDNTESHLTATNVQDAVDENAEHIGGLGNVIGMRGWNQLFNKGKYASTTTVNGITFTNNGDGSYTCNGTSTTASYLKIVTLSYTTGHKYLIKGCPIGGEATSGYSIYLDNEFGNGAVDIGNGAIFTASNNSANLYIMFASSGIVANNMKFTPQLFDLTALFGSGNEPTTVAEFRTMFPATYYPYCSGSWADLLWTNPNPSSAFYPQDVTLDLSQYKSVLVQIKHFTSVDFRTNHIIPKGAYANLTSISGTNGPQSGSLQIAMRRCLATDTKVEFSGAYYSNSGGALTATLDVCTPTAIYGIR